MPSAPGSTNGESVGSRRSRSSTCARSWPAATARSSPTPLADALAALPRGQEQAVLLINRRGAATFVLCRDCGESLRCPDCDLPFVYHLGGRNAALPSLWPRGRAGRSLPGMQQPAHPLLRRRDAASRGRSARPVPGPARRAARLRLAGGSPRVRDRCTTTSAMAGSTSSSGPSWPPRASTCRPSRSRR